MDDDAIAVVDVQQPSGVGPAMGSTCDFGSDSKWLEIGTLEMVDQTSVSWNRVVLWMRQLESLMRVS
jgi:hypothetical protein